jgi:hypothetical protein
MRSCAALLFGLVIIGACAAQTPPATAPDELVATPNRPTVTNTADTTQIGILELEFGVLAANHQQSLQGLLKFGLLRDLELQWAGNPWQHDATLHAAGVSDTNVGFRWRFLHQAKVKPTLSVQYNVTLPAAPDALSAGYVGHVATLLATKDLPHQFHLDANLNYQWFGRLGGFDHNWLPDFTLTRALNQKWSLAMEFSGNTQAGATAPAVVQNLWAVGYTVKPRLVLDSAVQFRVLGPVPTVVYLGGFTYSIADFYHHKR